MKKHLFLSLILLSFSSSIFFLSCGSENSITQPPESSGGAKPLAKLSAASIDHSKDTVISLPKSKKTIVIKKGLSKAEINKIDNFIIDHGISDQGSTVSPELQNCSEHESTYWETEQAYQSIPGKFLGIATNLIPLDSAHNTYGFTGAQIDPSQYATAIANFNAQDLAYGLPNNNWINAENTINNSNVVGYYFIDEPNEHNVSEAQMGLLADLIDSKSQGQAKFFFTEYNWPANALCNAYNGCGLTDENYLDNINTYIQCDQYQGNCCAVTAGFWDEYQAYFTASKNISNWMSLNINADGNPLGRAGCNGKANTWSDLFGNANRYGMNNIWLYADNNGVEANIQEFCLAAYEAGWLLQEQKQVITNWECSNPNPCTNCSFPDEGNWYIVNTFYTGLVRYIAY
jgi:hypothetical protein